MAQNKNQHFVPKYYFRNFSEDEKLIHILLKKNGFTKIGVSIRDQCSKNNFYLSKDIEKKYSDIENNHSKFLKVINNLTSLEDYNMYLSADIRNIIFQAILFQHTRTSKSLNDNQLIANQYIKEICKIHFQSKFNNDLSNQVLDNLQIDFQKTYLKNMLNKIISHTFLYQETIKDLKIYVLNNTTDKEFIFSDHPTVFYNLAYRNIKSNSMTALQSPGLMIFFPISKTKCILLLDEKKYQGSLINNYFFNISKETDINAINKLQIHNSLNSIYISNEIQIKHISKLYRQEKNKIKFNKKHVNTYGNIIKIIPEQLNYELKLSFIEINILNNNINIKYRDKKLYELLDTSKKVINFIENEAKLYKKKKEKLSETCDLEEINNIILNKLKIMKVDEL